MTSKVASVTIGLSVLAVGGMLWTTLSWSTDPTPATAITASGAKQNNGEAEKLDRRLIEAESAREKAETKVREAEQELAREREARAEAERASAEAAARLVEISEKVSTLQQLEPPEPEASEASTPDDWNTDIAATSPAPPQTGPEQSAPFGPVIVAADDKSLVGRGRQLMSKGQIEEARRLFQQAADEGRPEGALALGSTYDPVSLASIGLASTAADPNTARHWYRRAHELAAAPHNPQLPLE
jgi:TPR repeat protein